MQNLILTTEDTQGRDYRLHTGQQVFVPAEEWLDACQNSALQGLFAELWTYGVTPGWYTAQGQEPIFRTDRAYYCLSHPSQSVPIAELIGLPDPLVKGYWYDKQTHQFVCHSRVIPSLRSYPRYLPRILQVAARYLNESLNHWYIPNANETGRASVHNLENMFLEVLAPELRQDDYERLSEQETTHLFELNELFTPPFDDMVMNYGMANKTRYLNVVIKNGMIVITAEEDYRIQEWNHDQLVKSVEALQAKVDNHE